MTFGEELRRERELREIPLRDVADATKISLRYLQALETNKFDELPGGVFNRGFVRAYSQFIGVDGDSMVNAYLLEVRSQETEGGDGEVWRGPRSGRAHGDGVNEPRGGTVPTGTDRRRLGIALAALGAVAALAALILWWGLTRGGAP